MNDSLHEALKLYAQLRKDHMVWMIQEACIGGFVMGSLLTGLLIALLVWGLQ